jgi:hypothetical protein
MYTNGKMLPPLKVGIGHVMQDASVSGGRADDPNGRSGNTVCCKDCLSLKKKVLSVLQ